MIHSANGTISTEQPESEHVHQGYTRRDETGQTIPVNCPVPYHQHFDGEGGWIMCADAVKRQRFGGGRVIKHGGYGPDMTGQPVNLPR